MHNRSCLAIAVAALAAAVASSAALAAPLKACDLISQQTAATISGVPMKPGAEQNLNGSPGCVFDDLGSLQTVSLGIGDPKSLGASNAAEAFKLLAQPSSDASETITSIAGLGEANFYRTSEQESSITILYHDKIVVVDAAGSHNPALKTALVQTARLILLKL
jgi:hypothetical protein